MQSWEQASSEESTRAARSQLSPQADPTAGHVGHRGEDAKGDAGRASVRAGLARSVKVRAEGPRIPRAC